MRETAMRETSARVTRALKDAAFWGLVACGLFLPLIGFYTTLNIHNELTLQTRWPLFAALVLAVAAARLAHNLVVAPLIERRRRTAAAPAGTARTGT